MPRRRTALRESSLIKISIHKLIYSDGGWEKQIGPYSVALIPKRVGNEHRLSLFVNGQRQQKVWQLAECSWGNRYLLNGGYVPPFKDQRYYIFSPNGKRRYFVYINPRNFTIGTKDEMNFRYDSGCLSRRQRMIVRECKNIRNPKKVTERERIEHWVKTGKWM